MVLICVRVCGVFFWLGGLRLECGRYDFVLFSVDLQQLPIFKIYGKLDFWPIGTGGNTATQVLLCHVSS